MDVLGDGMERRNMAGVEESGAPADLQCSRDAHTMTIIFSSERAVLAACAQLETGQVPPGREKWEKEETAVWKRR